MAATPCGFESRPGHSLFSKLVPLGFTLRVFTQFENYFGLFMSKERYTRRKVLQEALKWTRKGALIVPAFQIAPTLIPKEQLGYPEIGTVWSGVASWYSEDNCYGCGPELTMRNGQRLDDSRPTIAFMRAPLDSKVKVTNLQNGLEAEADVTDWGDFESVGRIADINIRTALDIDFDFYNGLTEISIELLRY